MTKSSLDENAMTLDADTLASLEEMPKPPTEEKRPRKTRAPNGRGAKKMTEQDVTEGLMRAYGMVGTGLFLYNQFDGLVVLSHTKPLAESLVAVGKRDPRVWAVLVLIAKGNDVAAFVGSHLMVASAIAANHSVVPWQLPQALGMDVASIAAQVEVSSETPQGERTREDMLRRAEREPVDAFNVYRPTPDVVPPLVSDNPPTGTNTIAYGLNDSANSPDRSNITAQQVEAIRAEAIRNALREQQQALQAGPDGVPNPAENPALWHDLTRRI